MNLLELIQWMVKEDGCQISIEQVYKDKPTTRIHISYRSKKQNQNGEGLITLEKFCVIDSPLLIKHTLTKMVEQIKQEQGLLS